MRLACTTSACGCAPPALQAPPRKAAAHPPLRFQDVHAPECKRLLRCLSAVLNFAKYREDKLALLEELQGESLSMAQRHAELSRANAEKARAAAHFEQHTRSRGTRPLTQAAELERLEAERDASAPVRPAPPALPRPA